MNIPSRRWRRLRLVRDTLPPRTSFADTGVDVHPPIRVLTQAGNALLERDEHRAVLDMFHHLVDIHPYSLDGPWRLANLRRLMGDSATAIRYYEDWFRREPKMVPAREWLDRLTRWP